MKILVAYYTRTQTTKLAAEAIAQKLGADIEEIIDKKDRSGAVGWVMAGRDAMKKNMTEIGETKQDPGNYDIIIIGTPVWVGTMAPAIRTYIGQYQGKFKQVGAFTTQGSVNEQCVFGDLAELIGQELMAKLFPSTKEVRSSQAGEKISEFVSKLK